MPPFVLHSGADDSSVSTDPKKRKPYPHGLQEVNKVAVLFVDMCRQLN